MGGDDRRDPRHSARPNLRDEDALLPAGGVGTYTAHRLDYHGRAGRGARDAARGRVARLPGRDRCVRELPHLVLAAHEVPRRPAFGVHISHAALRRALWCRVPRRADHAGILGLGSARGGGHRARKPAPVTRVESYNTGRSFLPPFPATKGVPMKLHHLFTAGALALSLAAGSALGQDEKAKKQAELRKVTQTSLQKFYKADPKLKDAVAQAPGYAVFTTYGLSFLIGGAGGKGLVHDAKTK